MILKKLQEALAEVGTQRTALDEVEKQLRSMIAKLSGLPDAATTSSLGYGATVHSITRQRGEPSKLDEIAEILQANGKPMHITAIAEALSQKRGKAISRTAIEPGMNRHIQKTKNPVIARVGPSTFGLPEWGQLQLPTVAPRGAA
jgi:hypothetical protein